MDIALFGQYLINGLMLGMIYALVAVGTAGARGTDANSGVAVSLAPASSDVLTVQSPALLSATISAPAVVGANQVFNVTLSVSNSGDGAVNALAPVSFTLTGGATVTSGPTPPSQTLAGHGTVTFTWTCQSTVAGSLTASATVAGTDANDGSTRSASATTSTTVSEVTPIASDPFKDGTTPTPTTYAQLFDFNGRVYLGPSRTGNRAVRMLPDGSIPENVTFSLSGDTGGQPDLNSSPPPYPSFGYTGCLVNTPQCGPDNEDGRGLFASGIIAGIPWMIGAGSRSGSNLSHVYFSKDTGIAPAFSYVGMANVMPPRLAGTSAMAIFHDRIFLGFSSDRTQRPQLTVILRTPVAPGYESSAFDQIDLNASDMPGVGATAGFNANTAPVQAIDLLFAFNDILYLGNNGGWIRSTTNTPGAFGAGVYWTVATPSAAAYGAKVSKTTSKMADLTPADRALPAMAALGGKLYAARNTTAGPQLWICTPGPSLACDPGNWALLAANTAGDLMLSQFNDSGNTAVTLLAASSTHLFIGFDNGGGVKLYRSANSAPATLADFTGQGGCNASSATCPGLGGNGLGAGATRIFDARALTYNGQDYLYLTAGTGSAGVRVFRTGG